MTRSSRSPPSRRAVLSGTAGLLALTAGCIANGSDSPAGTGDDPDADDESTDGGSNGDENQDDGDEPADPESEGGADRDEDLPEGLADYATRSFQYPDVPTEPNAALHVERDDAADWLADRGLEDESLTEFVDETDFAESIVVALEADAPDLCHELLLEEIGLDDGALTLAAAVSDAESDADMCAAQETSVGLLVRATFADERRTEVSVGIVDRNGNEREMGVAVETASESTAGSESESASGSGSDSQAADA